MGEPAQGVERIGAEIGLARPGSGPRTAEDVKWAARLFVETPDGKRVTIGRMTLVATGALVGPAPVVTRERIEESLSVSLGKDPSIGTVPKKLRKARLARLKREGITVTWEELIAAPAVFEFSDELLAALNG